MKLTKTGVEQAQPQAKRYRLNDSLVPGLTLLVTPSGAKTYYLRHRTIDGVQREMKLGTPVELTPDDARRLAREALAQVREGKDPTAEARALRKAATLAELRDRYMEEHATGKRSAANDRGYWKNHILPGLGERTKVVLLTHEAVKRWHREHPKKVTANRALEVLSKAMDLAEQWGVRPRNTNPCKGVKAHGERKRIRYLTEAELVKLRAGLAVWDERYGVGTIRWRFGQMVRLLLLTGARLRNVMEGRWEWVNWERGLMVVPPEDHKTGDETNEPLLIQLGPRAVEILRELQRHQNAPTPWLVPGEDPDKPMTSYRRMWLALLELSGLGHLRVHDLRHHFASEVLSDGYELAVVGQLLGHQSPQTTARYAHLKDQVAKRVVDGIGTSLGV